MLITKYLKITAAVCGIAMALTACSNAPDDTATSVLRSSEGILKYVPADTPYVFATPAAMPDDVLDMLEPHINAILSSYREIVAMAIENISTEMLGAGEDVQNADRFQSVANEFMGLMGSAELRAAGIPRNPRIALYGVGLLPVLRVELGNAAEFESTIARFEEKAGEMMSVGTLEAQSFRYVGDDEGRIILGVIDNYLVVTVVPTALSDAQLAAVLGITLPAENIGKSGDLAQIAQDYDYENHVLGFIDFERLVSTFLDSQDGVNAELLALMDYEDSLSDICRAEIRDMSGVMPRLVTGYTNIDVEEFTSNTVFELRPDIAAGMIGLVSAVPGLGMDHGGLLSFGMSINLIAAREFYTARLDAMEADPYQCELFAELQDGIAMGRQALQQPVPPIAYDFKGFLAVVDDIGDFEFSSQKPPSDIDMGLLVATENAEGLLAMGSMFSPELAALDLKPDGTPAKFEAPQVASQFDSVFIGMNGSGLGIAVGDNADSRLTGLLVAEVGDPPPFLSMTMDAARYYDLIGEAMMAKTPDLDDSPESQKMPEEARVAIGDVMQELGRIMDRISVDVNLTDRGIEIPTKVTLAQ